MQSNEIFAAIEEIAATASKNAKLELLKKYSGDADFVKVLKYSYDPFITFGMQQIPEPQAELALAAQFDMDTVEILDDLASRKLTGNEAREVLSAELGMLSPESGELLRRIIRKNLRAGFSESSINKAIPGLIPEFAYMRCSLPKATKFETWPWEQGVFFQEKMDAMFANVDHELNGSVSIRSRQGSPLPAEKFSELVSEVRALTTPDHQMHGELIVLRDGKHLPRAESNGVIDRVVDGGNFEPNERPIFVVWDQVPLTAVTKKGKYKAPYKQRLLSLVKQLDVTHDSALELIDSPLVYSLQEAYARAAKLMRMGKEGGVIKHPEAIWEDGTSKHQIKVKLEFNVDLVIRGISPGSAGTKNEGRAGTFACESACGQLKVDVTVKNEALRDRADANPDEFIDRIIAVTANDITEPGESNDFHSLYLPRMAEGNYRLDKSVADTLQQIFDQKEAAIFGEQLKEVA